MFSGYECLKQKKAFGGAFMILVRRRLPVEIANNYSF